VSIATAVLPADWATAGFSKYTIVADYYNQLLPDSNPQVPGNFAAPRRYVLPTFFTPGATEQGQTGIAGGIAVGADDLAYYGTGRGYGRGAGFVPRTRRVRWKGRIRNSDLGRFRGPSLNTNPYLPNGAFDSQNWLADHAFVNAPAAASNVVVFASREGLL